jgi:N6-adenosine-specific RNA methylase IME4
VSESPFKDLPQGQAKVLYSDPPWAFKSYSKKNLSKSPEGQYACMDLAEIKALPVQDLVDKSGCWCVMWATFPMLPQALQTMEAWGFKYVAGGAWGKQSKTGRKIAFGTGYIYRSAAELWLLGRVGNPKSRSRSIRNLILAPVREHSRKPDQMREMIEAQFDGPYVELFARQQVPGWSSFGNQLEKFPAKARPVVIPPEPTLLIVEP